MRTDEITNTKYETVLESLMINDYNFNQNSHKSCLLKTGAGL